MHKLLMAPLLLLLLGGCKEDKVEKESTAQSIDADFYMVKEKAISEKEPPQIVEKEEVEVPDQGPLLRANKARELRGKRVNQNRALLLKRGSQKKEKWIREEEDYSGSFPRDLSTLPVNRSNILTADMRIPAILEDSINTQTPGRLIAVIDRDVLSPNGKKILLPAYSKIICTYGRLTDIQSSRLSCQCKRIIRPDGSSVALTNATAADQMGRSGLVGELDRRTLERYGGAFGVSLISALANRSKSLVTEESLENSAQQFSSNVGTVTEKLLQESLDLRPILTIDQGTRIQIIPMTDIVFKKPYKKSDLDKNKKKKEDAKKKVRQKRKQQEEDDEDVDEKEDDDDDIEYEEVDEIHG